MVPSLSHLACVFSRSNFSYQHGSFQPLIPCPLTDVSNPEYSICLGVTDDTVTLSFFTATDIDIMFDILLGILQCSAYSAKGPQIRAPHTIDVWALTSKRGSLVPLSLLQCRACGFVQRGTYQGLTHTVMIFSAQLNYTIWGQLWLLVSIVHFHLRCVL